MPEAVENEVLTEGSMDQLLQKVNLRDSRKECTCLAGGWFAAKGQGDRQTSFGRHAEGGRDCKEGAGTRDC